MSDTKRSLLERLDRVVAAYDPAEAVTHVVDAFRVGNHIEAVCQHSVADLNRYIVCLERVTLELLLALLISALEST